MYQPHYCTLCLCLVPVPDTWSTLPLAPYFSFPLHVTLFTALLKPLTFTPTPQPTLFSQPPFPLCTLLFASLHITVSQLSHSMPFSLLPYTLPLVSIPTPQHTPYFSTHSP